MTAQQITHVLFDMDGLLLDTERHYTTAQQQICERYGKTFTWDLKSKMLGKRALDSAHVFISELQLEGLLTPQEFVDQREAILNDLFPSSDPLPGVERLVLHLQRHGIPMCVATSSRRVDFVLKTLRHGPLFSKFAHVITGDDVTRGKPDPDIFLAAAAAFDPVAAPGKACLVFEDAPLGVQAARTAGMSCVMVPDGNLDSELTREADQVLVSLVDFDPASWGLPAFDA